MHPYLGQAMAEDRIARLRQAARQRPPEHRSPGRIALSEAGRLRRLAGGAGRVSRAAGTRTACTAC